MTSLPLLVASNVMVACVLACLAFFVGRAGRYAVAAHLLWGAVFVKLVTPPIMLAPISIPHGWAQPLAIVSDAFGISSRVNFRLTAVPSDRLLPEPASWLAQDKSFGRTLRLHTPTPYGFLLSLAAVGTMFLLLRGIIRFIRFSVVLGRESIVDRDATEIVKNLIHFRASHSVWPRSAFVPSVRRISARVSPMLFGIGSGTCIVCPDRLWHSLSEADRRAFLAHEVAHYLRRDHWIRWLEWLVTAVYWWFPLVIVARRQLERHEEAACDAWAISKLQISPRSYAEGLLSVVDFLSDNKICTPGLACRMQATDSLEERLRLIMSPEGRTVLSRSSFFSLIAFCLSLLLIHPFPIVVARAASLPSRERVIVGELGKISKSQPTTLLALTAASAPDYAEVILLPPVPSGWWNEMPIRAWADQTIGDHSLRLLAEAGVGLKLHQGSGSVYRFDPDSVRALAYVTSNRRLIIGNSTGDLHLWDLKAMQSVSLIGSHRSAITSVAFHPSGGLVSGDRDGNLIAWDMQSGQIMGTSSMGGAISSVRWSSSGDQLVVVANDWASTSTTSLLQTYQGRALQPVQSCELPRTIAIAAHHEPLGWLAVDWSGAVYSLTTGNLIHTIPKADVSGIVLCQDIFDHVLQELFSKNAAIP